MNTRWLLRMSQLARHPPSVGRVRLVLGVLVAIAALVLVERFIGWPEALTLTR